MVYDSKKYLKNVVKNYRDSSSTLGVFRKIKNK